MFIRSVLTITIAASTALSAYAQEVQPTATPAPACLEADLATYASCIAACDLAGGASVAIGTGDSATLAGSQACIVPGAEDHFIAVLESAILACDYAGVDSIRKWNGLKKIPGALAQMGSITKLKAKQLARGVEKCIRERAKENRRFRNGKADS